MSPTFGFGKRRVDLVRWSLPSAVFLFTAAAAETLSGDVPPRRPPLPEPILTESVTDLDATEAGETEFALNGQTLRARIGAARARQASVEAEWRATRHLGLRLEPSYASLVEEGRSSEYGLQAAAAWGLLHDFANDLHAQVEATARLSGSEKPFEPQPGDSSLPFTIGVRTGIRFGGVTIRPGAGVEAGATAAHAPLWGGLGVLYALGRDGQLGFVAIELDADAGRQSPFIVAPNLMADTRALGWPVRVGFAIPWVVGASAVEPSLGVYLRVLVRTEVD